MKVTFLHLSDLHYRPAWPEECELVLDSLFKDIEGQLKNFENPYVLFSGDLVQAGDAGHYTEYATKVTAKLEALGIKQDRRICVPGNHDVSRLALKDIITIQRGALSELKSEELFNRALPNLSRLFFEPTFAPYKAAEREFATYNCCQSKIGGTGWELPEGVGLFCLNTALCSFGGSEDPLTGDAISDKDRLCVDTRSLNQWLLSTPSTVRVLVMHHPLEWLSEWAKIELENAIDNKFRLVFCGHIHRGMSTITSRGTRNAIQCVAPALFTRKKDELGYTFVTIDTETGEIEVVYRQKTSTNNFVAGVSLADNDTGKKNFAAGVTSPAAIELTPATVSTGDTQSVLEAEFDEACTCYSSKRRIWVDRDISRSPETTSNKKDAVFVSLQEISKELRPYIIRAPKEYGLTSLGKYLSLQYYLSTSGSKAALFCDANDIPAHRQGVLKYISSRCAEIFIEPAQLGGFIVDNWQDDTNAQKILGIIAAEFSHLPVVILQGFEDFRHIADALTIPKTEKHEVLYLWSLKRARIRELVTAYLDLIDSRLDEGLATKKVIDDIDALNMHRSPLNCLLILKLIERSFEDSPVNRTEVIGKVLHFLFYEFDQIPRYATRPDLKDCEFALGFLCEWLIRTGKRSFTKMEFFDKVREYCDRQMISLEIDVLFSFLATENIFVRRGNVFSFRLTCWIYYFAAHRMYHSREFAEFIFSDVRYAAFPEIIEFYTGIDRMRTDAITSMTADLRRMDAEFIARTSIAVDFNPLGHALWMPNPDAVARLEQEVVSSIRESALPDVVKDAIADKNYDNSRPYHQEVSEFINRSSLHQMMHAMTGAARALRNSDHVDPVAKMQLLEAVMNCWFRMCQILVILTPLLATKRYAVFEDAGFVLSDEQADSFSSLGELWKALVYSSVDNVVEWHQLDIFSKRLGALFEKYVASHHGEMGELFVILLLIKQRPPGWEVAVKNFILRSHKNSFYLYRVHENLWNEFRVSFANEKTRQELRNLAAMSVAKHKTGVKHPNIKLVERAAKALDETIATESPRTEE